MRDQPYSKYIVQNKESVKLLMFTAIDLMMRLLSKLIYTVNVERFAGLNIYSFSPIKVFVAILLQSLGQQCAHYLTLVKYSWEQVLLKTMKVLAQQMFPHLS